MDNEVKKYNESKTYRTQYTKDSCIFGYEAGSFGC